MSSDELNARLARIKNRHVAEEVRRFLLNLFILFDNAPPSHIQHYILEIVELAEGQKKTPPRKVVPAPHGIFH